MRTRWRGANPTSNSTRDGPSARPLPRYDSSSTPMRCVYRRLNRRTVSTPGSIPLTLVRDIDGVEVGYGGGVALLDLTRYDALSFDCYGTLIDWEAGLAAVLGPWAKAAGSDLSVDDLLVAYSDHEAAVEAEMPSALYPEVLAEAFR